MNSLAVKEGDQITADWANALLAEIARRTPDVRLSGGSGGSFLHPFKVTAARDQRPANLEGRAWQIRTALGSVNDTPAATVYRNSGDPRDWIAKPLSGIAPDPLGITDRTMLELDDPPYHLLTAPGVNAPAAPADDFTEVADAARPAFFRTAAIWEKKIYQAFVTLTNLPTAAASPTLPAILLSRLPRIYRLVSGRKPVIPIAYAGGVLEVATLYLLRDDDAADCFSDTITVRQRVFWNLGSLFSQPANPLDGADTSDPFGQIVAGAVGSDLEAAAAVSFWTQ